MTMKGLLYVHGVICYKLCAHEEAIRRGSQAGTGLDSVITISSLRQQKPIDGQGLLSCPRSPHSFSAVPYNLQSAFYRCCARHSEVMRAGRSTRVPCLWFLIGLYNTWQRTWAYAGAQRAVGNEELCTGHLVRGNHFQ